MDRLNRYTVRLVLAVCVTATLGTGVAEAKKPAGSPQTFGAALPAQEQSKNPESTPSEQWGVKLVAVPEVRLGAIDRDAVLREDAVKGQGGREKALRFAIARDVRVTPVDGNWYDLAGGARLWVGDVVSTDALGLRLHFKDVLLPEGARLTVYAPSENAPAGGAVAKNGYAAFDPERHVESFGAAAPADFWTGTQLGDRARIEYLAPAAAAAAAPGALPFAVDRLQHVYLDPVEQLAKGLIGKADKAAGPCHNDVTCFPEWADVAKAVSGIGIVVDGGTIFCTGQLINDQAQDFTPYYLTAHHCLSTQGEAGASEFFWLYQTSTCNGTPPSLGSVPRSSGSSLVSTNSASDYTLLLINGAIPADKLFWAGWTAATVANGTDIAAIHHPSADFKRISFGFKDEGSACPANHVRISWTDGPTEGGSSGSGVFREDTQQLFGQLHGGPSSCGNETFDCYGAFSSTYPKIKNPLKQGSDDKLEPKKDDSCANPVTVKKGTTRGLVAKVLDPDWYRISVPPGKTLTVRIDFANGNGDLDLAFLGSSCGDPVETSTGTGDSEEFSLTNTSGRAAFGIWQVYLASDTRNEYNMTVSVN